MNPLSPKYHALGPRIECVVDPVVLAQAWKKAHTYIRRHNWYADTLELDVSAIDLEDKLAAWSDALSRGEYVPSPSWLVPAPKNSSWSFDSSLAGGWGPDEPTSVQVLRPLAHLGIREQTVATALMLCLADCVESIQGNTALAPELAAAAGVSSYGNRLYCSWNAEGNRARFSWGNADTYSRYFQDYQRFVERPTVLACRAEGECDEGETIYIAKLDLSAFYDRIDRGRLLELLRIEYDRFRELDPSVAPAEPGFWLLASQILDFSWRDEDRTLAELLREERLPNGLPQGLVASGFFANVYLLEFDRHLTAQAKRRFCVEDGARVRIYDYCRYVDDLRLVISVQDGVDETTIAAAIARWINEELFAVFGPYSQGPNLLRVNSEKTELERYDAVGVRSSTAARMKSLQHQLSGPFDMATLQQLETSLNGLLAIAELGLKESPLLRSEGIPLLASVSRSQLEVRDDTLTRFSAYRLTKSLRMRRSMTDLSEQVNGAAAVDVLLHDYEVVARRLISAWAANPSLVQVLRYALDLFPSPELLDAVIDALTRKLRAGHRTLLEERVAFYVAAELFKAGATETGRRATHDLAFPAGDIQAYRERLRTWAIELLTTATAPWYVVQQIAIFLAAIGVPTQDLRAGGELRLHRVLHNVLLERSEAEGIPPSDEVAISLVSYRLRKDLAIYIAWFRSFVKHASRTDVTMALLAIARTDRGLLGDIVSSAGSEPWFSANLLPKAVRKYVALDIQQPRPELPSNVWISLAAVISHPSGIFAQENALLQLALALSQLPESAMARPDLITPANIKLKCADWSALNDPRRPHLAISLSSRSSAVDPLYALPDWCDRDFAWMYAFGRVLRSAATGELDYTARHWLVREETGWYRGVASTWFKRRIGMAHSAQTLRGTGTAITPWFSSLLLGLLRWPGIAAESATADVLSGVSRVVDFANLISHRISQQATLYGASSNLPIYRYPVNWALRENRQLRVVLVQGLMPSSEDVSAGLEALAEPRYRERHRNHTASILNLVYRQLAARDSVLGERHKPQVDLVMFSEYSIHVDDQDLMRAFSDSTGAMLFYGLMGAVAPETGSPVNAARWLVPQRHGERRSWVEVDQGKWYLTDTEDELGVTQWRPYQVVIELRWNSEPGYRISGAVCYDATDLSLAADLKGESHMFVVAAMNKDVKTFDSMVAALRYHMYQHVLIVNAGEFGGSTAQAPYELEHRRLVSHVHGSSQIAVSVLDLNVDDFGPKLKAADAGKKITKEVTERIGKTRPAGLIRRI